MSQPWTIGPGRSTFIAASNPFLSMATVVAGLTLIAVAPVTRLVADVVAATIVAITMADLLHLSRGPTAGHQNGDGREESC
jgi:hypothetical protein